jgi:hypothetical protein
MKCAEWSRFLRQIFDAKSGNPAALARDRANG